MATLYGRASDLHVVHHKIPRGGCFRVRRVPQVRALSANTQTFVGAFWTETSLAGRTKETLELREASPREAPF